MKRTLTLIAFVITYAGSHAQAKLGLKAGLNIAKQHPAYYYSVNGNVKKVDGKTVTGLNGAVFADVAFDKHLLLRPEVGYSGEGFKIDEFLDFAGSTVVSAREYHLHYINIPLKLLYTTSLSTTKVWAGAGAYGGVLLGGKVQSGSAHQKLHIGSKPTNDFKRFDYGVSVSAGVKFKQGLLIGADYAAGLKKVKTAALNKNRVLGFYVGYVF